MNLEELIEKALTHFGHTSCSYCGANIRLDNHVSKDDIQEWLKQQSVVVTLDYRETK